MVECISGFKLSELENWFEKNSIPKFRAIQVFEAIHSKQVKFFDDMKNIPLSLRKMLSEKFYIIPLLLSDITPSYDKTEKYLFETVHSKIVNIESVLITEGKRETVCVSSQAGCNVGCEFCATGKMGLLRNLTAAEIVFQVYNIINHKNANITNVVFMGMGEPLLNYDNTLKALEILTNEKGLNISSRRITVSTVGLKDRIKKFADDISQNKNLRNIKLALSLHTINKGLREKLIPIAEKNELKDLFEEMIYFYRKTGNKVTYEYIHFPGINDTDNDVKRLSKLMKMIPSNLNIIPFHPIGSEMKKPLDVFNRYDITYQGKDISLYYLKKLKEFVTKLSGEKVIVNVRKSSGKDIRAACGQLAIINYKF